MFIALIATHFTFPRWIPPPLAALPLRAGWLLVRPSELVKCYEDSIKSALQLSFLAGLSFRHFPLRTRGGEVLAADDDGGKLSGIVAHVALSHSLLVGCPCQ